MAIAPQLFWTTQGQNPAEPVIQGNAPGYQQPDVTTHIPGSVAGAIPSQYVTSANAVYPLYGPGGNAMPIPDPPLDPARFTEWHSGYQAEEILANPTGSYSAPDGAGGTATVNYVRVPANLAADPLALFVLTRGNTTPVDLVSMTLSDYAALSDADKSAVGPGLALAGTDTRLGLVPSTTALLTELTTNFLGNITGLTAPDGGFLTGAQVTALFSDQMQLVLDKVALARDNGHLIVAEKIKAELGGILKRFTRAKEFSDTQQSYDLEMNVTIGSTTANITNIQAQAFAVSSDDNQTIRNGYTEFIRAETAIITQKKRRDAMSLDTGLRNPKLDVANLIYQLQMHYEAEAEGIADAGTEEIKQLHQLLQDYGMMQQMLNETLKHFDPSEEEETRRFMNLGGTSGNTNDTALWLGVAGLHHVSTSANGAPINNGFPYPFSLRPNYHWLSLQQARIDGTASYPNPLFGIIPGVPATIDVPISNLQDFFQDGSGVLSQRQMRVFSMFNDDPTIPDAAVRRDHPIESFLGLFDRPKQEFTVATSGGLAKERSGWYQTFLTQLNDRVTLLNQKNQIKQNEIENASRRQNRHFDLGNNALRKMNDMLMTIGRM